MLIYLIAGVFVAAGVAAFFFKEQLLSILKSFKGDSASLDSILSVLPEVTLSLDNSSPSEWVNKDELEQDEAKLEKQGLVHQGYFTHRSNKGFVELSLWKYKKIACIALCNTIPEAGGSDEDIHSEYSASVLVRLDNGGTLCISNAHSADLLPRHPKHKMVKDDSKDIFHLMKMLKENTPENTKITAVSDTKLFFTNTHESVSGWLWQEAQLISGQFEEACESINVKLSDDDIDELITIGQEKLSKSYTDRILNRLKNSARFEEESWDGMHERLIVIHEKMEAEDISNILYRLVTDMSEDQEEILEDFSTSGKLSDPIASFGELMISLNSDARRVASMSLPIAAEVYLKN